MHLCVAGAGFSGSVLARSLADAGWKVSLFEAKQHVAGHCHTQTDPKTGINVHVYGPHIFHTDDEAVWSYVQQYDEFTPYMHKVMANVGDRIFTMPVNLHTINQLFDTSFSPAEARLFIDRQKEKSISSPQNFEEQALKLMGKRLYEAFFYGYTKKQWGLEPRLLPENILKRLPFRYNYNNCYFSDSFQGIPKNGYTYLIERILNHPNIEVHLNTELKKENCTEFDHCIWTGPIDAWFGSKEGSLPYRTLDFKKKYANGDFQGCAVMNYCDEDVPCTRITEHKHFTPGNKFDQTVYFLEYSRQCGKNDSPYYPVRLAAGLGMLDNYINLAANEKNC